MPTMKALVSRGYGVDALAPADVPVPEVRDGFVLVRVRAASLNALDWSMMSGAPLFVRLAFGFRRPRLAIRGVDVAGTVEAGGRGVTRFRPGEDVFGLARGSLAEFALTREDALTAKPAGITLEQAAALPIAGLTALRTVRDGAKLQSGQRVLVDGASGGVGTFVVQLAKAAGAKVSGVCGPSSVDVVRACGADRVFDYTREDFARDEARYDVVIDNVGSRALGAFRRVLSPDGILVLTTVPKRAFPLGLLRRVLGAMLLRRRWTMVLTRRNPTDLAQLGEMVASGTIRPFIAGTYSLAGAADAFRQFGQGHTPGKIVITV